MRAIEFFRSNRKPSFVHDCSQIASLESGKALAGGQASVAKNHEIRYARFGDGALVRDSRRSLAGRVVTI